MLWTIFVILLILWLLGFSFHVAGGLIHLLLVIAVVVLIIQLITGRRVVTSIDMPVMVLMTANASVPASMQRRAFSRMSV